MGRQIRVEGVRRDFDPKRYAALIIALAKHLADEDAKPETSEGLQASSEQGAEGDDER